MTVQPSQALGARRRGMTLLEVVIALAIFLFSLVALSQLVSIGSERALDVQQQAQASMLCQSKLAEVVIGSEPLEAVGFTSYPDDASNPNSPLKDFQYSIEATESDIPKLWKVKVTVQRRRPDDKIVEAVLTQMVLEPSERGGSNSTDGSLTGGSSSSSSMGAK